MKFEKIGRDNQKALASLFRSTFGASEGEGEGLLIGDLADQLGAAIDDLDVMAFGATQGEALIGAIFFTRLRFADDARVYMLAPVAVATAHQGAGLGQALIRFGLEVLAGQGATVAITYGDPAYYGRFGFAPLSEGVIRSPVAVPLQATCTTWLIRAVTVGALMISMLSNAVQPFWVLVTFSV